MEHLPVFVKVKQRFYQDSLKLMRVSGDIEALDGIKQAFAFMGTAVNKTTRIPPEVLTGDAGAAGPDDLILMVECDDAAIAASALQEFDKKMTEATVSSAGSATGEVVPTTLDEGLALSPDAGIAIISVPGQYAAAQAMRALQLGLSVHMFSDNVPLEDEISLKKFALEKGLLFMGPDCGTAIIQGVPLCFANKLRRGGIGIIAASGTGAQEVGCIIDDLGEGVSHIIGVGGRDLSQEVAGLMTLRAIELLANDPETKVIAIVSKPPAKSVADKVLEGVKAAGKPAVLIFMGYEGSDAMYAPTLETGAKKAVELLTGKSVPPGNCEPIQHSFLPSQTLVRGMYTGGTLASEAEFLLAQSNIKFEIIDLGDDEYTRGALHPMIDPANRSRMVHEAAKDPTTAIILCDVVIGYGSHPNPAGELVKALENTNACVIASVTGTDADPQNKGAQERILRAAGVHVFPSNQQAVEAACALMNTHSR